MHQLPNAVYRLVSTVVVTCLFLTVTYSCGGSSMPQGGSAEYEVSITNSGNTNAPSLQSFAHGIYGNEWLLFAGRTNNPIDSLNGGLHNINANYADKSFKPASFNESIFVYNVESDSIWSLSLASFVNKLKSKWPLLNPVLNKLTTVFVNSNALVTQDKDDYLYLIGGYGPTPGDTTLYVTFNQVVKIHIPTMIAIIKGMPISGNIDSPIRLGSSEKLISTGGELFIINGTFYLAGGHNFVGGRENSQQYVSAVYPFTISNSGPFSLDISLSDPITDAVNPSDSAEANNSAFRRRDAPMVPSLYYNYSAGSIQQGITFYGGVFQPGDPPRAWNNAIYITPGNQDSQYYYDSDYSQNNHNVYSCPDFEAFDSQTNLLHTFLMGGIGSGIGHGGDTLSGFTNNTLRVTDNVDSLKSRYTLFENTYNSDHYFGAEAAMILNRKYPKYYVMPNNDTTEVIDLNATFPDETGSIDVGYIYGGIQAFIPNPQSYGSKKSQSTNAIWKVTLQKKQ